MAIPKFTEDLEIISKLGDNPGTDNNLTSAELRAKFDAAALLIQKFINDILIPAANASSSPQEGLTMEGPINMGGQKLSGLNAPEEDGEASTKKYVDDTVRDVSDAVNTHKDDKNNPHGVTAEQVGAVEMKKLWENANPWSEFAAQTISVDLSGYNYIAIDFFGNSAGRHKMQFCKIGENCLLDAVTGSSDNGLGGGYVLSVMRLVATSITKVEFTKCVYNRQNSTSVSFTDANQYAVPHRIYGIKGVT